MELDELKVKWAEQDRKLDTILRLNQQLVNATTMNPARSALHCLAWLLALEAVFVLTGIVALGAFLYDNLGAWQFALPGLALDLFAIALFNALIRQMALLGQIDYGKPIATIQKQLVALRMMRIRYIQWAVLGGVLAWAPFMIVAFKGFFNLDVYQAFGVVYVSANLLFGVAFLVLALWLARKYGDRMGRSPFMQQLMKDLAGYNLNAAMAFLATLAQFEDEKHAG